MLGRYLFYYLCPSVFICGKNFSFLRTYCVVREMTLPLRVSGFLGALLLASSFVSATDFAHVSQREAWLTHPVYGEASFDAFTRLPGNPIVRGKAPHHWPVNGFLFEDPVSGNWYAYIGHYGRNYAADVPMVCTVSRSTDRGATWEDLGPIFPDTPHTFDGEQSPEGHAPDVSVVYADGKYHLVYDWLTQNTKWDEIFNPDATHNSGVGYAWSEKPEGPFHRSPKPVWTTRDQPALQGKYRRQYASTLIRRASDWLVLTLTDSGPNFGWAYLARTAKQPEGPWSEAVLLLHPERGAYHPPLLEFHPAFAQDGYVYAPATSVALNRNVQAMFRAPVDSATDPDAWSLHQVGSVWHAEPVQNEHDGIWGQTITGFVGKDGIFNVLFPSRDPDGFGTINLACRPWEQPYNEQGFVVSAHRGPSLALLKRAGIPRRIAVNLSLRGTARILWGANMPLGPDEPRSDAALHPLMNTNSSALEIGDGQWRLLNTSVDGTLAVRAEGSSAATSEAMAVELHWADAETAALSIDGTKAWTGNLSATSGAFGIHLQARSHARLSTFDVEGDLSPSTRRYLWTEGILGAAQQQKDWEVVKGDTRFTYGEGAINLTAPASAKWNVEGNQLTLYAPKGPTFGKAVLYIDGGLAGEVNYHGKSEEKSAPLFQSQRLADGRHTLRLEIIEGRVPVDVLEVTGG